MKTYNIHEAKTNLSKILNEVREGETVYIAKAGKKIVELKAIKEKKKKIPWGLLKDKMWVADDWDSEETNKEIAKTFYQESLDDPMGDREIEI
jgi:prevent-host-death family protein